MGSAGCLPPPRRVGGGGPGGGRLPRRGRRGDLIEGLDAPALRGRLVFAAGVAEAGTVAWSRREAG